VEKMLKYVTPSWATAPKYSKKFIFLAKKGRPRPDEVNINKYIVLELLVTGRVPLRNLIFLVLLV